MKSFPSRLPKTGYFLGVLLLGLIALTSVLYFQRPEAESVPIGGPFVLTDDMGNRVADDDYRGRWMLVYFGYSFCPDVCPTELAKISRALDLVEARGVALDRVAPLFITIDPERDTVAHLANYMELFHPAITGLTGTPAEIKAAAAAYRVYAKKAPLEEGADTDAYLMDHASIIYLMGRDGEFETFFSTRETADRIAAALIERLD